MKKVVSFIVLLAMLLSLTGCTIKIEPEAPGSFVSDGEDRFIFVDEWKENGSSSYFGYAQHCVVLADTVTGVMYLMVCGGSHMGLTALLCEDGSPMLYDSF